MFLFFLFFGVLQNPYGDALFLIFFRVFLTLLRQRWNPSFSNNGVKSGTVLKASDMVFFLGHSVKLPKCFMMISFSFALHCILVDELDAKELAVYSHFLVSSDGWRLGISGVDGPALLCFD